MDSARTAPAITESNPTITKAASLRAIIIWFCPDRG
jgi:hypothetical protein